MVPLQEIETICQNQGFEEVNLQKVFFFLEKSAKMKAAWNKIIFKK